MKTMMTATTSMASRRRRRASPGRASGLAPRSMIIGFAPVHCALLCAQATLAEQRRREDDEGGEFPGPQVAKRNLERLSL